MGSKTCVALRRQRGRFRGHLLAGLASAALLLAFPVSRADTVTYSYNANGQLIKATYAGGTVVTYTYDANGNRIAATVTPPGLSAPTGLGATAASPTEIDLSWTASSGATGYRIYRCQGSGCANFSSDGTSTDVTFSDIGLTPSTIYVYEVQAYNSTGTSSPFSASASAQTLADTTPPTVPTNLTASGASSQIDLSWSASTDNVEVAGYDVERCQGSGCGSFVQISSATGTSYSDPGVSEGVTYEYRVRAFDEAGNDSGYSNTAGTSLPDTVPPSVPAGLSASAASWSTVNLSWEASTDNVGVAGYRVYRNGGQIGTSAGTSYSDRTTSPSTGYSYTVSAYDGAGNVSAQSSAASVTTPATPTPSAPSGLSGSPVSNTQINLAWSAASDAGGPGIAGYKVFRNGTQIGTSASTSFADTGVSAFNTYSYTVAAYDTYGVSSAQSSAASVSTFYQITDSNGNVLSSASSLYSAASNYVYVPYGLSFYTWTVSGPSGTVVTVQTSPSDPEAFSPACEDGSVDQISSGYQLSGCVLDAAPSSYGH